MTQEVARAEREHSSSAIDMPDQVPLPATLAPAQWPVVRFWARHWTSITLLAALLAVLTLQSVRWPWGVRITGRLVAGAVTLQLDGNLDTAPDLVLQPPKASLRGTTWVRPPIELANERMAASSLLVTAAALHLSELHLAQDIQFTLEHGASGRFLLLAGGAGSTLKFSADGPLSLQFSDTLLKEDHDIAGLELSVGTEPNTPEPLLLSAQTGSTLVLDDMPASLIRFGRPRAVGAGFVSSIVSGSVKLVDVGDTETLEPGSALQIEDFRGEVVRLQGVEDGYRLSFTGRAQRVLLGPPGFAEDLTPSILEYLYHQDTIKMMWLSALAGLAAIAKVRSWLVGKLGD